MAQPTTRGWHTEDRAGFSPTRLQEFLSEQIVHLDVANSRLDIERFITGPQQLEIW
jgi:hypothetical protein